MSITFSLPTKFDIMSKHNNNSLIEHTKTYAEFSIKLKLLAIALLFCVGSYIDTRKNKFTKNDSVNAYSRKLGKKAHRKHHSKRKNEKLDDPVETRFQNKSDVLNKLDNEPVFNEPVLIQNNSAVVNSKPLQTSNINTLCPGSKYLKNLDPQRHVQLSFENVDSYEQITEKYKSGFKNASWSPISSSENPCTPRFRIAILIAFRNRDKHLKNMLPYLIKILQKQKLEFKIFIIEQTKDTIFHRVERCGHSDTFVRVLTVFFTSTGQ